MNAEPWVLDAASATRAQPLVRIVPGRQDLSIWSKTLFADSPDSLIREFLARVFSVEEVNEVEIQRRDAFGRLRYKRSADKAGIWRKLGRALHGADTAHSSVGHTIAAASSVPLGIDALYLPEHSIGPIRIYRVGSSLSSWRIRRRQGNGAICLAHPVLFNRKDIAYRLEEELAAILGVEAYRTNILTASVSIRFDPHTIDLDLLVRQLEKSWPRLLNGLEGPPSSKRLVASGGLLALSYTGQYLVPAVKPIAVLGVALYGAPNVINATKQIAHFRIGLPALYSAGLVFMLIGGMPFASSVMAVLMQVWKHLGYGTAKRAQRRLFAIHRRRAAKARLLHGDGLEISVDVDSLAAGDRILVREGEVIPVDGIVTAGFAAVDEEFLSGAVGAIDKIPGDPVYAASIIRGGSLIVRVEKIGENTAAGSIGARLPHTQIDFLPSSADAQRIANRNATPALAAAAINLAVTGLMRPSQALIRPDYLTAPQMTAQLGALHNLADGLSRGIYFRDPAALDRLAATDTYVFDDDCDLERRQIEVAAVIAVAGLSEDVILGYTAAAFPVTQNERTIALFAEAGRRDAPIPAVSERTRHAGVVRYLDGHAHLIEIAAPAYIEARDLPVPREVKDRLAAFAEALDDHDKYGREGDEGTRRDFAHQEPLRPAFVLRDGVILGVVILRRQGKLEARDVITALKAHNKRTRFIHISSRPQEEAQERAERVGISTVFGNLDHAGKIRTLERLGHRIVWVGDGAAPGSLSLIKISAVSISVGGLATIASDAADITLLQPGLAGLVPLRSIGRAHRSRIEADYRMVYAANLIGAAGGFAAGFGSLESGLVSHAATGIIFIRHWKRLHDLVSRLEKRRTTLLSSIHMESDQPIAQISGDIKGEERLIDYRDLNAIVEPDSSGEGI
ncbi:ATPase [Beijerinckia indica]|uniref:P-type ATPase n=1 Tax=Beijerinckia indica TaxID=533 RepID=UPI001FCACDC9|nr:ATPase [Beijerinckia indica]